MAATRVKDLKAVAVELEVRLLFETKPGDEAIAAAALGRLPRDVSIPENEMPFKAAKGWVIISGPVDYYYQKSAAE